MIMNKTLLPTCVLSKHIIFGDSVLFLETMTSNYYHSYLQSSTWKARRKAKLQQAKYKCKRCGERIGLQVHHLNYDRLGDERTDDLIVLCRACHWVADIERNGDNELRKEYSKKREKPFAQLMLESGKKLKYIPCKDCGFNKLPVKVPNARKMREAGLCEPCYKKRESQ